MNAFARTLGLTCLLCACSGTSVTPDAPTTPALRPQEAVQAFLAEYDRQLAEYGTAASLAAWDAYTSGDPAHFATYAAHTERLMHFHSDAARLAQIDAFLDHSEALDPLQVRALHVARLAHLEHQLPAQTLAELVAASTAIEQVFNTFRGTYQGQPQPNNTLLGILANATDEEERHQAWLALKEVGHAVAPQLIALAKLRNAGATQLGFANYWDMQLRMQDFDPAELVALFEEIDRVTREPFARVKAEIDAEVAQRLGLTPRELMPWHYDNPFFQSPPPAAALNLDTFFEHRPKEEIVEIARAFFAHIGTPIDAVIANSDLWEREGKDQHAYAFSIDRADDVRTLLNIRPTADWMDTMLHEQGHAIYDLGVDRSLPYLLRAPAHAFTTEGIAMAFGALARDPAWLATFAKVPIDAIEAVAPAIFEQQRREQLLFARWTLVMFNFERALYEDPDQDLNRLWWDMVERFQGLRRPLDRDAADWASKPHFTIAPVYYHNYMLGEVFAAQLRATLGDPSDAALPWFERPNLARHLAERVFAPGMRLPWSDFVTAATGQPLSPVFFVAELTPPAAQ